MTLSTTLLRTTDLQLAYMLHLLLLQHILLTGRLNLRTLQAHLVIVLISPWIVHLLTLDLIAILIIELVPISQKLPLVFLFLRRLLRLTTSLRVLF